MPLEPRIRVSAVLRWEDRVLLCRHEKSGREYWLLPGGGVNSGESLVEALRRELAEEVAIGDDLTFEGPVAVVDSIAPKRAFVGKHVVHIIFAADLSGRSLERVNSTDAAVRGHRLFVPPMPFGHEFAGPISAVGAGVAGWHVGDAVTAANSDVLLADFPNSLAAVTIAASGAGSVRDVSVNNISLTAPAPTLPSTLQNLTLSADGPIALPALNSQPGAVRIVASTGWAGKPYTSGLSMSR